MPRLFVVGSVNYDLIMSSPRLPEAGESFIGATFYESCGGKGANQAVAAARAARILGSGASLEVAFCGAIGRDAFGEAQRANLEREGIDTDSMLTSDTLRTGTASVWVEESTGQNRILSAPGANNALLPSAIEGIDLEGADLILVPNEIPAATLAAVAARAVAASVPLIFNPAPFPAGAAAPFPTGLATWLTPNEIETAGLLGRAFDASDAAERETAARELLALGAKDRDPAEGPSYVAMTLGAHGSFVAVSGGRSFLSKAPKANVVDTTGAGDAFNGALAAALLAGDEPEAAVAFAVRYASASVEAPGTQTAFPTELASQGG